MKHRKVVTVISVPIPIRVEIVRDGFSWYAHAPELPGLRVGGETVEEVMKNSQDAIKAYIQSLIKHADKERGDAKKPI